MQMIAKQRRWWIGFALLLLCLFGLKVAGAYQTPTALAADDDSAIPPTDEALDSSPYIIGGQEAAVGAWPWLAALVQAKEKNAFKGVFCGGTLIHSEWVLSAAHCTFKRVNNTNVPLAPAEVDIVLGRHKLSSNAGQRLDVTQIIRHPNYNPNGSFDYDVALFRLAKPSTQTTLPLVDPLGSGVDQPGTLTMVAGWGLTVPLRDSISDVLRQVSLPLVSFGTCTLSWGIFNGVLTPRMICAGLPEGGKTACSGDSGGPLMVFESQRNRWLQVGVVSWGRGNCSFPNSYGVYARVSEFSGWISQQIPNLATPTPPPTNTPTPTPTATVTPTPLPTPTGTITPSIVYLASIAQQKYVKELENPGFESSNPVWRSSVVRSPKLLWRSGEVGLTIPPHSGSGLAWLGQLDFEVAVIEQSVSVPEERPILHYWHWVASGEGDCIFDFGGVVVNDVVVEKFALCAASNTNGWQQRSVNLSAYAGQIVKLQIRAETDPGVVSNLYIDDVSFEATANAAAIIGSVADTTFASSRHELPSAWSEPASDQ